MGAVQNTPTPISTVFLPPKHIWLCIPQELGLVLGMCLPKGWGLAGPGGTALPSALPPTHPSPLSDPETDPEFSQSRRAAASHPNSWWVVASLLCVQAQAGM